MPDLFVAHTPQHVLLAAGLARPASGLVLVTDFPSPEPLTSALSAWPHTPFTQLHILPGACGRASVWRRSLNVWRLRLAALHAADRLFVCHDHLPEDQAILRRFECRSPATQRKYLAAGTSAYDASRCDGAWGWWTNCWARLCFGTWVRNIIVSGTHPSLDGAVLLFPDWVRPELQGLDVETYATAGVHRPAVHEFVDRYWIEWERIHGPIPEVEALVLAARHEAATQVPAYGELLRRLCGEGRALGVRYHPQETASDPLRLGGLPGVTLLPPALPVEYLFVHQGERLRLVVGDVSAELILARHLASGARVVSLAPLLGGSDERLLSMFRKIGIEVSADLPSPLYFA